MKILFFSRTRVKHSAEDIQHIFSAINQHALEYGVNAEVAPIIEELLGRKIPPQNIYTSLRGASATPSVMLCYGGDGTILDGAQRLDGEAIPIAGINSGRLGYLATTPKNGITKLFDAIVANQLRIEERSMLCVEGDFLPDNITAYAINEVAAQRFGATMISVELYLNEQLVSTYHGDGTIVATPTGSTAYSLSAGGPILSPDCNSFVITPLAPHNLTMRPVVLPDSACITLRVKSREGDINISIDNNTYHIDNQATIHISRSSRKLYLATMGNNNFYDTLRDKMMWGVDPRTER